MATGEPAASGRVLRVAVVTTGNRADLQPSLALACGLQRAGFELTVVTHGVYRDDVASAGLPFSALRGDPSFVLRSSAFRSGVLEGSMLRIASLFKAEVDAHIEENMHLILDACRRADLILCSVSVLTECCAIAQQKQIPVILCPQLPFSPTGEIPLATLVAEPLKYSWLNKLTYELSGLVLWGAMGSLYNRFRVATLGIGPQSSFVIDGIPQVTGFNAVVVPRPTDWDVHVHMAGAWRFDEAADLRRAQRIPAVLQSLAGVPSADPRLRPLFMTFQSVPLPDPIATIRAAHATAVKLGLPVVFAAGDTDMEAIQASPLLTGLPGLHFALAGGRDTAPAADGSDPHPPAAGSTPELHVLVVTSVAYSWILPRCSLAVHEGSSALTQAVMDAGIPSVIFPAFGDAFFWAARASTMGISPPVYFPLRQLPEKLLESCVVARHPQILERAAAVGDAMRSAGNGVQIAVRTICRIVSRPQSRHAGITCKWATDASAPACNACSALFTLLRRRHHCRSCGCVACSDCVSSRCHLPGHPENAPQMVCKRCFDTRVAFFAARAGEVVIPDVSLGASAAATTDVEFAGARGGRGGGPASRLGPAAGSSSLKPAADGAAIPAPSVIPATGGWGGSAASSPMRAAPVRGDVLRSPDGHVEPLPL